MHVFLFNKVIEKKIFTFELVFIKIYFKCVHIFLQYWGVLEEQVVEIANKYPSLHLTRGRKVNLKSLLIFIKTLLFKFLIKKFTDIFDKQVIEIRPSIKWDKGRALEYLLDTLGFANDGDAIPVYIGDDRTDEDAFKVCILI